jgi:hypothetical protein
MPLPNIEPLNGLEPSQFALVTFMRHWSEELRAAQWYGDLEYFLLTAGRGTVESPGLPPLNFQDAYRILIQQAGGWFTHGPDGPEFVAGTYEDLLVGASRGSH